MSVFTNCENCMNLGTRICGCEDPPRFFCNSCVRDHILSSGKHITEEALESLSASQVSSIQDAHKDYQFYSIRKAIDIKRSRTERLLQKIRTAKEEYLSVLETILRGPIARNIEEVLSNQALPLFSSSPLVKSLLDLKHTTDFSSFSIHDLFMSLDSSFQSYLPPYLSVQTYSSQLRPPSIASRQRRTTPEFSIQSFSSEIFIAKTVHPKDYQWELLNQIQAHSDWINSIAVSEFEKYLATASNDHTIKIWDLQTLRLIRTLEGHTDSVFSVEFLGNKILSGSIDKTIKIWEENRCLDTLELHSESVNSISVSSCKRFIVSGSDDKTAVVCRLEDKHSIHTLKHRHWVLSVAFSRNDRIVVSGTRAGWIKIWNTDTGELLKNFNAHYDRVSHLNYSGKFIVSSSGDKTVKIWDINQNELFKFFNDHTGYVSTVDVRDNLLASLAGDNKIIVRDIKSGTIIQILEAHGYYFPNYFYVMGLKILEGGMFIISGGMDGKINIWRRFN